MKPIIISVEGNIGSGKSTLVRLMKSQFPNCKFIFEPVETWLKLTDSNKENILDKFYKDKKRWSYTFQNFAYITRIRGLLEAIKESDSEKPTLIITERCVLTDKNVFAKMLYESGDISELEMKMYLEWFNLLQEYSTLNGIIYLNTDPVVSNYRIQKRNRPAEKDIQIEYLDKVHESHEEWLKNDNNIPMLELDGNLDFESDNKILKCYMDKIDEFAVSLVKSNLEDVLEL